MLPDITPQPNVENFLTAIRREREPERVPFLELFQDWEIMVAVAQQTGLDPHSLPDETREHEVVRHVQYVLGYDMVRCRLGGLAFPRDLLATDDASPQFTRPQRGWTDEHRGPIGSWEDFERYPWPDPANFTTEALEYWEQNLPDGMGVYTGSHQVFEQVTWLMGYETLCLSLYDQPDLVDAMFGRIGSILVEAAKVICQFDCVTVLFGGDDMGHKTGTMIGADVLIEKSLPWHAKISEVAHAAGKPNILHSCGNLGEVMETIIEDCHYDAKHSFEDTIEPVWVAKERWGDRIALCGGVDVDFLCRADEEQLRERVRFIIECCAPGGGYCLGSGNSVANYVPLENYLIMLDEGWKVGRYG